jgi:hypothetical protein
MPLRRPAGALAQPADPQSADARPAASVPDMEAESPAARPRRSPQRPARAVLAGGRAGSSLPVRTSCPGAVGRPGRERSPPSSPPAAGCRSRSPRASRRLAAGGRGRREGSRPRTSAPGAEVAGSGPDRKLPERTRVVTRLSRLPSAWTRTDCRAPTRIVPLLSPASSTPVNGGSSRCCVAATPEPVPRRAARVADDDVVGEYRDQQERPRPMSARWTGVRLVVMVPVGIRIGKGAADGPRRSTPIP